MRMYSITPDKSRSFPDFADLILRLLLALEPEAIRVIKQEDCNVHVSLDGTKLSQDRPLLRTVLQLLIDDHAFFVLASNRRFLLVPFEGQHFNLILHEKVELPNVPGLCAVDSSELLQSCADAYEAFGIDDVFSR